MTFNKHELERISGDYRNVEQKAEEIVSKFKTNQFKCVSYLDFWEVWVCIHYISVYGTINCILVPIVWFELEGDSLEQAIKNYSKESLKGAE